MPTLYTWHSPGFDIRTDRLDRDQSPYCDTGDEYLGTISCLSEHLGTDQYVFCFVRREQHGYHETDKPIEWIIEAEDKDILTYIDNNQWETFRKGNCSLRATLRTGFTGKEDWSAIVKVPVPVEKVRCRRVWKRTSLYQAELESEEVF